jgi:hypothetical protein
MPPEPVAGLFSGTVAELFATLGLDATGFREDLQKSKVQLQETGQGILTLYGLLKQLEHQAGPTVATAAFEQLNKQLSQSTAQLFAWQRQVGPALQAAQQVAQAQQALLGQAAAGGAGGGALGGAGGAGGAGGSANLVTRLTERFVIYQALRTAVNAVTDALHGADDITRRMDQTGWGSEGVQRLALEAQRLNAPVDQATAAIARFEQKVDSGDLSLLKAFDRLGIKFSDFRNRMAEDPQSAVESVFRRMNTIQNQGEFSDMAFALFNDRSGKMLAFIREWGRMKKEASNVPLLSDEDRQSMERLNFVWTEIKQGVSVGITRALVGAAGSQNLVQGAMGLKTPEGLSTMSGPNARRTDIELPRSPSAPGPLGSSGAASNSINDINRMLDEYRSPYEMSARKLQEDWSTMLLLERQGVATHAQVVEFQERVTMKMNEEYQKQVDAIIRRDVALLNEFGAQGKRTAESMTRDFAELTKSFRDGRVSIEEFTEATANYFSMLEDNAARPALKEAIRMFEQGLIGPDELLRARQRAQALGARGEAESAFEKGTIGPRELMDAQRRYRRSIEDFAPDRGSDFFLGPGGTILRQPRTTNLPPLSSSDIRGPQGSINIIPMDQFSNMMLRRWKQQGY